MLNRLFLKSLRKAKSVVLILWNVTVVDFPNFFYYLSKAPRYGQLIYINPQHVVSTFSDFNINREHTGQVLDGDWDLELLDIDSIDKIRACKERFATGHTWEQVGYYNIMREQITKKPGSDGCYNDTDIQARCDDLDRLYEEVRQTKRLKSRKELNRSNFRELGGIYIHIGRKGDLIFGGGGCHRLAIAKALNLNKIPAQLGVVHSEAVDTWKLILL